MEYPVENVEILVKKFTTMLSYCLFGLVVRVPGYRPRGPEFDSRRYQIF
jgi:hypothetical protein